MAVITSQTSYDEPIGTGTNREDLADFMWDISPFDTPGITAMGRSSASAATHDHPIKQIRGAASDNFHIEGSSQDIGKRPPRVRMSNVIQSYKDWVSVSHRQEVVDKAGMSSEVAVQKADALKAIKTDVETTIFATHQAKAVGDDTANPAKMASFSSYCGVFADENDAIPAKRLRGQSIDTPSDNVANIPEGDGSDAYVSGGTARALDQDLITANSAALWEQVTGNPNILLLCSATHRGTVSTFTNFNTRRVDTDDRQLTTSIDVLDGDFHTITVAPSRFIWTDAVLLFDPEYAALADLISVESYQLGKLGDVYQEEIHWETCLEMCHPRGHRLITELT